MGFKFFYALHYTELFSSTCLLSANIGSKSVEELQGFLRRYSIIVNKADTEKYFPKYSTLFLIEDMSMK
jgi:hypothetical protein